MKSLRVCLFAAIAAYTVTLMGIEYQAGQDHVRHYFTDITGPVRFYAVNTTLSAFLLWSVALIFTGCWIWSRERSEGRRMRLFYGSQAVIFAYLGFDERFKAHEWLAGQFGVNDAFFLLPAGVLELAALLFLADIARQTSRVKLYLLLAAVLFGVMLIFDVIVPHRMLWRLSIEDLAKLWSDVFLLLFAWEMHKQQMARLMGTR